MEWDNPRFCVKTKNDSRVEPKQVASRAKTGHESKQDQN